MQELYGISSYEYILNTVLQHHELLKWTMSKTITHKRTFALISKIKKVQAWKKGRYIFAVNLHDRLGNYNVQLQRCYDVVQYANQLIMIYVMGDSG